MTLHPVESSAIQAIGHDPEKNVLRIAFHHSGHIYDFAGVDKKKHEALLKADSVGKHFALHIQPHHKYTRVTK